MEVVKVYKMIINKEISLVHCIFGLAIIKPLVTYQVFAKIKHGLQEERSSSVISCSVNAARKCVE